MHKCIEIYFSSKMTLRSMILMKAFDSRAIFLKQCHFQICFFCIKSHDWGREEFLWVPSPDCNTAELRNECFSLFMLSSFSKQEQTLYLGEPNNGKFSVRQRNFWDRSGKFWKWHCLWKEAIKSKRLHQTWWSWCHLAGKRILYAIMHTTWLFFLSFSWNNWM